jgi:hypothetical protein
MKIIIPHNQTEIITEIETRQQSFKEVMDEVFSTIEMVEEHQNFKIKYFEMIYNKNKYSVTL